MNSFEAFAALMSGMWIEAAAALVALAALVVSARVLRRSARDRQRLEVMRRDLQAFTEASTRVADALDHLLTGTVEPVEHSAPSRRYQLVRAREGLENGETIDSLASRLDLCEDERKLLEFLHGSGRASNRGQALAKRAWVA